MDDKNLRELIEARINQGDPSVAHEIMDACRKHYKEEVRRIARSIQNRIVKTILEDIATMKIRFFGKPMWKDIQHRIAKFYRDGE